MEHPAISIIVPVYNIAPYLAKCLDSILAQTFKNFEVILVNDGSTDQSGLICDVYEKKDKRVKVIHKENGGVSSARNTGINMATGDYIGFVDGDDWVYRDMFYNLYHLSIETHSDITICTLFREINGKVITIERKDYIKEMDNFEAMKELFKGKLYRFALWNKLYKKSCFKGIVFPEGRIHEDLATTYKLLANSNKVTFTNYTGYVYLKRENSILTTRYYENRLESFIAWEEIIQFMNDKYSDLSNEYISCFVYWAIDNLFYVLNQVSDVNKKREFLYVIQKYLKKYKSDIKKVEKLSLKYRFLIRMLNYNPNLLLVQNKLKSSIFPS